MPDHGRHRVPYELVPGQPVRRRQTARLQVHQVRRQDEPLLRPLVDGRRPVGGPLAAPDRPCGGRVAQHLLHARQAARTAAENAGRAAQDTGAAGRT
ncbi:hypothetical protein AAGT00_21610 [Streptomyces cavourensis]